MSPQGEFTPSLPWPTRSPITHSFSAHGVANGLCQDRLYAISINSSVLQITLHSGKQIPPPPTKNPPSMYQECTAKSSVVLPAPRHSYSFDSCLRDNFICSECRFSARIHVLYSCLPASHLQSTLEIYNA